MKSRCETYQRWALERTRGELPSIKNYLLTRHLSRCDECASQVKEDAELACYFNALPRISCPEPVLQRIRSTIVNQRVKAADRKPLFTPLRLSLAASAIGAILLVIVLLPRRESESTIQNYSAAEVEKARKQAEWSLALTGKLIRKNEKKVIRETIIEQFPSSIRKALDESLKIF